MSVCVSFAYTATFMFTLWVEFHAVVARIVRIPYTSARVYALDAYIGLEDINK